MPNLEQHTATEWLTELRPAESREWPPPVRAVEIEGDNPERLQSFGSLRVRRPARRFACEEEARRRCSIPASGATSMWK